MHTQVVIQESLRTRLLLRLYLLVIAVVVTWFVAVAVDTRSVPLLLFLLAGTGSSFLAMPASVRWALLERAWGRIVLRPDAVIVRNRLGSRVLTWYEIRDLAMRTTTLGRSLRDHTLTRAFLVLSSGEELAIPCCFAIEGLHARFAGGPVHGPARQEELLHERVDLLREAAYQFTWREELRAPVRTIVEPFGH